MLSTISQSCAVRTPSLHILPSLPFTSSHRCCGRNQSAPVGQNLARIAITFIDISTAAAAAAAARSRRATGSLPIDQFRLRVRTSDELQRARL